MNGFSTAAQLTDVSGRAAGLSAVREAVGAVGGKLEVESHVGLGTQFLIHIPKPNVAA